MTQKTYLWILKVGLFITPISFLLVFAHLLFPYITSKQLFFNILMEVLLPIWLVFIIKFKEYRPKKSLVTWGLVAYFVAVLLSCFVGFDFNLSFWGNAERMLGFFHLLHFLIFYLIIITAFKTKQDWSIFFNIFLGVLAYITLRGFVKHYPASTIGNTAYVAGLMIFGFFISLWKIIEFKKYWIWLYVVSALWMIVGFLRADISGSQAGLAAGLFTLVLIYSLLTKNKKIKIAGLSLLVLGIASLVLLFSFRFNPVFDGTKIGRALRDFSSQNSTWNTRLISWTAAYKDFWSHPILGVGHGNYAIIFDKYFDPRFYDFSPGETYFDRAHNNIVDIASTTGLIGLLAYLSILVALVYYLVRGYRYKKISTLELSVLSGLFVAYLVQNLAVFDSLSTYISFFMCLGLVYYLYYAGEEEASEKSKMSSDREAWLLVLFGAIALFSITKFNINGYKMFVADIAGYGSMSQGDTKTAILNFQKAFQYRVGYNRDSRGALINMMADNPGILYALPEQSAKDLIDYAVSLAEANVAYDRFDSLMQLQLAKVANLAARINYKDLDKFNYYSKISAQAIEESIMSSPGRYVNYLTRADIYLTRGDKAETIKSVEKALEIRPVYLDAKCQMADVYYYFEDEVNAYKWAEICLNQGSSVKLLRPEAFTDKLLEYFAKSKKTDLLQKLENGLNQIKIESQR